MIDDEDDDEHCCSAHLNESGMCTICGSVASGSLLDHDLYGADWPGASDSPRHETLYDFLFGSDDDDDDSIIRDDDD